jgi:hypothetical protein
MRITIRFVSGLLWSCLAPAAAGVVVAGLVVRGLGAVCADVVQVACG